jgi:hypothetical protein
MKTNAVKLPIILMRQRRPGHPLAVLEYTKTYTNTLKYTHTQIHTPGMMCNVYQPISPVIEPVGEITYKQHYQLGTTALYYT